MTGGETGERGKPVIFSAPMIKALLQNRKTQTRRIFKPQPEMRVGDDCVIYGHSGPANYLMRDVAPRFWTPYTVGDRLWVREACAHINNSEFGEASYWQYRADTDGRCLAGEWPDEERGSKERPRWRPSIHMPRAASRLTLTVTDVRVHRLQEISEEDAEAEGCEHEIWDMALACRAYSTPDGWFQMWGENCGYPYVPHEEIWRASYRTLWESLHGKGSWEANPWVAAYSFDVHHGNIDTLANAPSSDREEG